jgi:hypothetical protein
MAKRRNPLLYWDLIALALCLLLAPALPVAAGNADGPTCDPRFITVDPPGSNPATVLGINDWRQMTGERTYDSVTNVEHTYSLNGPGGEFTTFDPPGSIDKGGLRINDPGGIAGFCLRVGSDLIRSNLNHPGGGFIDAFSRGTAAAGAQSMNNPGGGGHRHTAVVRCFTW